MPTKPGYVTIIDAPKFDEMHSGRNFGENSCYIEDEEKK